jgi:hypothetical protein
MVAFREHYLLILEPENFSIYKNCLSHSTLGFVIGSRSEPFQDYIIELLTRYLELWQSHYNSGVLKEAKGDISQLIHRSMTKNRITIRTLCALSVLAYYIAAMHGNALHLRQFTVESSPTPQYYTYIGVPDYSCEVLMQKISKSAETLHQDANRLHYFLYPKDIHVYTKSKP